MKFCIKIKSGINHKTSTKEVKNSIFFARLNMKLAKYVLKLCSYALKNDLNSIISNYRTFTFHGIII